MPTRRRNKAVVCRLVLPCVAVLVAGATPAAADAGPAGHPGAPAVVCTEEQVPVAAVPGGPADLTIFGELCHRGPHLPRTVLLLVPGNTYNHGYWDVPGFSGRYSYARQAAEAGYAVFAVDPLGTGHSSHPVSTQVTLSALSFTMHQVVTALKDGTVGGPGVRSVVYVGHSLGAETGWLEAATYHDVDALVSTGALHAFNQSTAAKYVHDIEQASADPAFAALGLDAGYVTTLPGIRGEVFDNPEFVDPGVVAFDEATKDVGTLTESAQSVVLAAAAPDSSVTRGVTVPVLIAVGGQDALNCGGVGGADCTGPGTVAASEDPYYAAADQPDVLVAPWAGHDLALAPDAPLTNAAIDAWLWRHVRP